jgi:(2Fe-2S) ferredoxin
VSRFERHIFVCQTERPPAGRPSCSGRGGAEILAALSEGVGSRPELWGKVAVTGCGCLGPCFDGPNLVVYPEGIWYAGVRVEDVSEIIESHMRDGRPVERLRYCWPED